MKKLIACAFALCACLVVRADNVSTNAVKPKLTWDEFVGGRIFQPNSSKGKVVFLDVCGQFCREDYQTVIGLFEEDKMYYVYELVADTSIKVATCADFAEAKKKTGATVLVVVFNDEKLPAMLAAPEDGWAGLNVAKLYDGLATDAAKAKFARSRMRKMVMRTFAYACGCGGSGYPGNTLNVSSVAKLDYVEEFIPIDAVKNILRLSPERGLVPRKMSNYRRACREGWAPAPTNAIQKAVWDKVHELPSKPIKIEYNEKRDKGK